MLHRAIRIVRNFFSEILPHAKSSVLEAQVIMISEFIIFFFITISLRVEHPSARVINITDSVNKLLSLVNPQYLLTSLGVEPENQVGLLIFYCSSFGLAVLVLILINIAKLIISKNKVSTSNKLKSLDLFPYLMTLYMSYINFWSLIQYNILFMLIFNDNVGIIMKGYCVILMAYFLIIQALAIVFFNDNSFPAFSRKGVAAAFVARALARTPSLLDLVKIPSQIILTCCTQLMYSYPVNTQKYLITNSCLQIVLLGLYDVRLKRKPLYFITSLNKLINILNTINLFSAAYFVCSIPLNIIQTLTIYSITLFLFLRLIFNWKDHIEKNTLTVAFYNSLWPKGDSSLVEHSIREVYSILIFKGANFRKLPLNLLSNIVNHGRTCPSDSCFSKISYFHDLTSEKDEMVNSNNVVKSLQLSGFVKLIITELYEASLKSYPKSIKLRLNFVNFFISERKLLPRAIKELIYIKKNLKKTGNVQESFLIKMCEKFLQQQIKKNSSKEGDSHINMEELLSLESDYFIMLELINDYTITYRKLLVVLGGDSVDLKDICKFIETLLGKLTRMADIAKRSRGNPRILKIYLIFLKDVRKDDYNASTVAQELKNSYSKIISNKRNQKTFFDIFLMYSKNTSLIELSSDSLYPGIIRKVNQGTCKLFGYSVGELEGYNVKMLMPSGLAKQHDNYLTDFLKTGKRKILGKEQHAYANSKTGSNMCIMLLVKPLYRIAEGNFSYTSFIQPIKNSDDRIITDEYGLIDSVSNGFLGEHLFNNEYKHFKSNNFYIQTFAPMLSEYFFSELMKKNGMEFSYEFFETQDGYNNPRYNFKINDDGDYAIKFYIKRLGDNTFVESSPDRGNILEFFRDLKSCAKKQIIGARVYKICFKIEDIELKNVRMKIFIIKSFDYLYTKKDKSSPTENRSEKSMLRKKTLVIAPQVMQNIKKIAKVGTDNLERKNRKKEKTTLILEERNLIKQETMAKKAGRRARRVSSLILQKEVEITQHQMNYLKKESMSSESDIEDEAERSSVNTSSIDEHISGKKKPKINTENEIYQSNTMIMEEEVESPTKKHKSFLKKSSLSEEVAKHRRTANIIDNISVIHDSINPMNDKDDGGNKVDAIYESKRKDEINIQKDLQVAINKAFYPSYVTYLKVFLLLKLVIFLVYFIVAAARSETGYHLLLNKISSENGSELILIKLLQLAQETLEASVNDINIADVEQYALEIYKGKVTLESTCFNDYCNINALILKNNNNYMTLSLNHAINMLIYNYLHFEEGVDMGYVHNNLLEMIEKQWNNLETATNLSEEFSSLKNDGMALAFALCSIIMAILIGVNYMGMKCYNYFYQTLELILAPGAEVFKKLERKLDEDEKRSRSYFTYTSITKTNKTQNKVAKSPVKIAKVSKGTNRRSRKNIKRGKFPLVRLLSFNVIASIIIASIFILLLQFSSFLDNTLGDQLSQTESCQKMKQQMLLGSLVIENNILDLLVTPKATGLFTRKSQDILQDSMFHLERVMETNSYNTEALRNQIDDILFGDACPMIMSNKKFFRDDSECRKYTNGLLTKGLKSIVQYLANSLQSLELDREKLTPEILNVTGILLEAFELLSSQIEYLLMENLSNSFHDIIKNASICAAMLSLALLAFSLVLKLILMNKLERDLVQAKRNLLILPFSVIVKEFRIVNYLKNTTGKNLNFKTT